jgi:hypothetical protein
MPSRLRGDLPRHGSPNRNGCATLCDTETETLRKLFSLQRFAADADARNAEPRGLTASQNVVTFVSGAANFVTLRSTGTKRMGRPPEDIVCLRAFTGAPALGRLRHTACDHQGAAGNADAG